MKHRRSKQTVTLEDRLAAQAKRFREEAPIAQGSEAETGAHMTEWLTSPGLQPPK